MVIKMSDYHVSVLLDESVDALNIDPSGVYVDVTYGAGGHSQKILNKLDVNGRLFGFDQDDDAFANMIGDPRLTLIRSNFRFLKQWLKYYGVDKVDGILADLGVSSHQFDEGSRGFSYRFEGPVDMRMNLLSRKTAQDVLVEYREEELVDVFSAYGQVRNSKQLASRIVKSRLTTKYDSMADLIALLDSVMIGDRFKYYAQVFQALRIEVNEEMDSLEEFLSDSIDVLSPGGRLVVISYHSLEDKMVKNFINTNNRKGQQIKDEFGRIQRLMNKVGKGLVVPDEAEMRINSRSRSAKMRIAEKAK